ncbi:hypothetical protein CP533_0051 [Ophiocordyceps camponoti-saundersi (nom. inval.)]|nr:hypothetical protein CP533_0051 [Ophiocordyceps camponoti-saundersi (nom. inval.)]
MFGMYRNLLPSTRLKLGLGFIVWASAGLYFLDHTEEKLNLVPKDKDKEELRSWIPTLWAVDKSDSK